MAYSEFEQLPLLVLETVYEYVTANDWHGRSIAGVSLTSKRCYESAARERLGRIKIAVTTPSRLDEDLGKWQSLLHHANQYRYVRHLQVTVGFEERDDVAEALPLEEQEQGQIKDNDYKGTSQRSWQPLSRFVAKCHGLRDLVWDSYAQVPPCIVEVLHNQLSKARLHVHRFSLRSLFQQADKLHNIDPDEYALATSSNLYSINASSTFIDSDGNMDYTGEAVLELVVGLAPRLAHVDMGYQLASNSPELQRALSQPRPDWNGFFGNGRTAALMGRGALSGLTWRGSSSIFPDRLREWQQSTDFTKLRVLSIHTKIDLASVEMLMEMANNRLLDNLHEFSFWALIKGANKIVEEEKTAELVASLPYLEALTLRRCSLNLAQSIIQHPRPILSKLHLSTLFSLSEIQHLHIYCPNLVDLQLSIHRTHGDEQEVTIYRALGTFSKLTSLTLLLNHSDAEIPEYPTSSDTARMNLALRNSAIDASLAHSVFRSIFHSNRSGTPASIIPRFTRLRFTPQEPSSSSGFAALQKWIARGFDVVRKHADVFSDEAWVEEIVDEERRRWIREDVETWHGEDDEDGLGAEDKVSKEVWEDVWPEAKGIEGLGWIDEWRSFPLVCEGEGKGGGLKGV